MFCLSNYLPNMFFFKILFQIIFSFKFCFNVFFFKLCLKYFFSFKFYFNQKNLLNCFQFSFKIFIFQFLSFPNFFQSNFLSKKFLRSNYIQKRKTIFRKSSKKFKNFFYHRIMNFKVLRRPER